MTEKKTTAKDKVVSFVKKHEKTIIHGGIALVSSYVAITISRAWDDAIEDRRWDKVEKHEFFADADIIARTRNGKFFKLKEVDEEKYEDA